MLKLESLTIERQGRYSDDAGKLKARCVLKDDDAELTVKLSPEAIAKIINVIAAEVQAKSKAATATVAAGLRESAAPQLEMAPNRTDD